MTTLFGHEVRDLHQESDGTWTVKVATGAPGRSARSTPSSCSSAPAAARCRCCRSRASRRPRASAASRSAAQFLRTDNPELTAGHQAKVYGKPPLGAPPMSVPHLDTRVINGKSWLLFGPFAGWSPKFLKQGKITDLPLSVKPNNLASMLGVGLTEIEPGEVPGRSAAAQREPTGSTTLREFAPSAVDSDWELDVAGQRVQVIRRKGAGGVLEFGTTVLSAGRRQHRRSAGRLAGRLDRGAGHARRDGALLRRPATRAGSPSSRR